MSARRNTVTSRRRSSGSTTKLLGAVKLQSPLGALGSDAGARGGGGWVAGGRRRCPTGPATTALSPTCCPCRVALQHGL